MAVFEGMGTHWIKAPNLCITILTPGTQPKTCDFHILYKEIAIVQQGMHFQNDAITLLPLTQLY